MMRSIVWSVAIAALAMTGTGCTLVQIVVREPQVAQAASQPELTPQKQRQIQKARNIARQAAERVNGGLSNYRAESTMHGPWTEAPYELSADENVATFTFRGRRPEATEYAFETEVRVELNSGEAEVLYNGTVR